MGNALSRNAGSTKRLFENERKFMNLKYLKNRVELKLFERKLEFWKLIWKLKSRKLNLKIGILKELFENGSSENSIWKLEFWKWEFWKLEN